MLTLCSLNFHSVEYLQFQDEIASKLAKNPYKRVIIDSSNDIKNLQKLPDTTIIDGSFLNKYEGSSAHSHALNNMIEAVNSKYAIIIDPDIVPLRLYWDEIILNELKNGVDWIGVSYNPLHGKRRIQGVPSAFFVAFNVDKIKTLHLNWSTFHQNIRKAIYLIYYKIWQGVLKRNDYPKWFDFENGFRALIKIKRSNLIIKSFELVQPWDTRARLKFDIAKLPGDKSQIDPICHFYPEEWHFQNEPFLTHQRKSYKNTFNEEKYSKDWIRIIKEYLENQYKITIH